MARKAQSDRYNVNKDKILHESRSVANKAKARERYQANSLSRSEPTNDNGIKEILK